MASAPEWPDAEGTFLAQLERIDRIIASIARRNSLVGDEADDFASWARARLIENDYASIRKFEGRSSIGTFLTVVIANLYRDYRTHQLRRWHPSAAAKRLGGVAVRLETLLVRDGYTLTQAIEVLRSAGIAGPSERELRDLAARLPPRTRPTEVGDAPLEQLAGSGAADGGLWEGERARGWEAAQGALERALSTLSPEDQLILRLRYWEGFTIAEVARALRLEQKPLYRRIDGNLARLRAVLESEGVDRADVAAFLSEEPAG